MGVEDNSLHLLVGELTATVKATSDAIAKQTSVMESLRQEVSQSTLSFSKLEMGLNHANNDIRKLRELVLTPDQLRQLGIALDDAVSVKLDMTHLRSLRTAHDERKPINVQVRSAVIAGILLAVFGYLTSTTNWFGFGKAQAASVSQGRKE